MLFYVAKEAFRQIEGSRVPGGTVILRKSVNGESYGINLLLGLLRASVRIQGPVCAAEVLVVEPIEYQLLCLRCHIQVRSLAQNAVGAGISPEYPGTHNTSDFSVGTSPPRTVDAPQEHPIRQFHFVDPERKDIVAQFGFRLLREHLHTFSHISTRLYAKILKCFEKKASKTRWYD